MTDPRQNLKIVEISFCRDELQTQLLPGFEFGMGYFCGHVSFLPLFCLFFAPLTGVLNDYRIELPKIPLNPMRERC